MAIDGAEIRLECLKLAYRHDRGPETAVAAATVLEAYVLGMGGKAASPAPAETSEPGQPVRRGPGRPRKDRSEENPFS